MDDDEHVLHSVIRVGFAHAELADAPPDVVEVFLVDRVELERDRGDHGGRADADGQSRGGCHRRGRRSMGQGHAEWPAACRIRRSLPNLEPETNRESRGQGRRPVTRAHVLEDFAEREVRKRRHSRRQSSRSEPIGSYDPTGRGQPELAAAVRMGHAEAVRDEAPRFRAATRTNPNEDVCGTDAQARRPPAASQKSPPMFSGKLSRSPAQSAKILRRGHGPTAPPTPRPHPAWAGGARTCQSQRRNPRRPMNPRRPRSIGATRAFPGRGRGCDW